MKQRKASAADPSIVRNTSRTRSSPRGEARRRMILDCAFRLFSDGGFHTASLADISAEVGLTQAGLLHHFPSKSALLVAVLEEREQRQSREEQQRQASGMDWISAFLHTLHASDQSAPLVQLMALLSAESIKQEHPAHDWFVDRYRRIVQSAANALKGIVDEAKLPEGASVETVARWFIAVADGLRLQYLLDPERVSRVEITSQLAEVLRPYLKDPTQSISWKRSRSVRAPDESS